jgi:hypothetical protein
MRTEQPYFTESGTLAQIRPLKNSEAKACRKLSKRRLSRVRLGRTQGVPPGSAARAHRCSKGAIAAFRLSCASLVV